MHSSTVSVRAETEALFPARFYLPAVRAVNLSIPVQKQWIYYRYFDAYIDYSHLLSANQETKDHDAPARIALALLLMH